MNLLWMVKLLKVTIVPILGLKSALSLDIVARTMAAIMEMGIPRHPGGGSLLSFLDEIDARKYCNAIVIGWLG